MIQIDIVSGFLGAGKTTFIKKLIQSLDGREKLVIIENEFGEISIDGALLKNTGAQIREINSGCICCSLTGDFEAAFVEMAQKYHPDRIIVEPSGVGKLSDVAAVCERIAARGGYRRNIVATIVDAVRFDRYLRNFSEFYRDQIEHAHTVVLSKTAGLPPEKIESVVQSIRSLNGGAAVITTPWDALPAEKLLEVTQGNSAALLSPSSLPTAANAHAGGHDHDHTGHHHDAEDVFQVWSAQTAKAFDREELRALLRQLDDGARFGAVLRAKGILPATGGEWLQFDYVPGQGEIVPSGPEYTGRLCVIGHEIRTDELKKLFGLTA